MKTINLAYQDQHEMKDLNYRIDLILFLIFWFILSFFINKHEMLTDKALLTIYISRIQNIITFKTKTRN